MNFVAECTTMSAPNSIGLSKYGVAKVLSTIRGMPCEWAIVATLSISVIFELGLPKVSRNRSFVFSLMAFSKFSGLLGSTNVVSTPDAGNVCANKLYVPPYIVLAETIWSPARTIFEKA